MTEQKTPQQSLKKLPRLYVGGMDLSCGVTVTLAEEQSHYLRNVMRQEVGAHVRLFNGTDGEWIAEISSIGKKICTLVPSRQIHPQVTSPDIVAIVSLVKKDTLELMIEKASELGAARFIPVISDHSSARQMNAARAQMIAIEAAEQCERLDVMQIDAPKSLAQVIQEWDVARPLLMCSERSDAPLLTSLDIAGKVAVLIGPEGGFSDAEKQNLAATSGVQPVSLGARILRAETALILALGVLQLRGS